ncbi:MAG: hypothetical protein ABIK18_00400 [candidate division WOR-3 bacterium]
MAVLLTGCGKKEIKNEIVVKEIGLKMKIPAGWQLGIPSIHPGKKYRVSPTGDHCFPSEKSSYPFGRVWVMDLAPFSSLKEFVSTTPTLHGLTVTQVPMQICGYEGFEIISSGLGENRVPVQGVYQYIRKGDKVIVVSFLTLADSFATQESLFRLSLKSLVIE